MSTGQTMVQVVLSSVCLLSVAPSSASLATQMPRHQREQLRQLTSELAQQWPQHINLSSLQGRTIRLGVKQLPTAAYLKSSLESDRWSYRMIDLLATEYGFTAEYVLAKPAIGGVPAPGDGEWSGLTGQLIRREVDMTGSFLGVFGQRRNLVSFGETISHSQIGLLIQKPHTEIRSDSLLAPFSRRVWLMILVSLVAMGPVIWAIIRLRVWLTPGDRHLSSGISLTSCVWFVFGALMKQGSILNPIADSSRLLLATWWMFISLLAAFYTANLTAYMTLSTFKMPLKGLQDLRSGELFWMAPAGGSIQLFVDSSETLTGLKNRGRGDYVGSHKSLTHVVSKVLGGGYVYIDEVSKLNALMMHDYHASNRTCRMHVLPLRDQYIKMALAVPQQSPINDVLNPFIHRLVVTGIASKWMRDAAVNTEPCDAPKGIQSIKLKNEELRMIYYILLTAYVAGGVLLLLELALARVRRQCSGGASAADRSPTLSTVGRILQLTGGGGRWWRPATKWTGPVVAWSGVFHGSPVTPATQSAPAPSPAGAARSDAEVHAHMRQRVRLVNGRPYMFIRDGSAVRAVPVTESANDVFERIFQRLKQQPPVG